MVKLTKNELKKQKDALKRFQRYLPTLQLKKQQLQMVIRQVETQHDELQKTRESHWTRLSEWLSVFAEKVDLVPYVGLDHVETSIGNIAGIDIPVYEGSVFAEMPWDIVSTPFWVDSGVAALKSIIEFDAELKILERQLYLLGEELRTTTQRVNLFEKVKIPETKDNIRMIQIYLGDQQTAAVVRGKISKRNLVRAAS